MVKVQAKELQGIQLYQERGRYERLDVLPFIPVYALWLVHCLKTVFTFQWDQMVLLQLGTVALLAVHALVFLSTVWSVDWKCAIAYRGGVPLERATHVKVLPHALVGSKELVPLETHRVDGAALLSFSFRKLRFLFDPEARAFLKLKYPSKLSFAAYRASGGYGTDAKLAVALERWGPNRFEVPVPRFAALMQEQLLAPFFCFQVFCVALWALDDYWYYSLFTLMMLVTFEATVVNQRLRNLQDVRALQAPKLELNVYRGGRWGKVTGDGLVPGDVVEVVRPAEGGEELVAQADMLLLAGNAIVDESVLTGESTPQWKNPVGEATGDEIDASEAPPDAVLSIKRDKMHVLFGGTKVLQTTGDPAATLRTPDRGCLAVVLRTGFGTAQGRLMRTILYSTERVSANNAESFLFILFLLVWAVAASAYVLYHGLQDPDRDRFKLALNCIMILTSVIPPELPMELTIAVNASLLALARLRIYCTEPFRIPLAGKVTTCCFDKTGTLTSDEMVLEGVAGAGAHGAGAAAVADVASLPIEVSRVLAACQSLVSVERGLVGDPVEKAALEATAWAWKGDHVASPAGRAGGGRETARVVHRFHFSSALKRMSTVAEVQAGAGADPSFWVLTKGAPEVVRRLLRAIPAHYDATYKHHAADGARVLAMAYRRLPPDATPSTLRHLARDEAEAGLEFAGFAVFRSPLKPDSEPALRMLRASGHQLVMITGDAPLTAVHAARAVHIVTRPVLLLTPTAGAGGGLRWETPDETTSLPFSGNYEDAAALAASHDLCVTGDALARLVEVGAAEAYIPLTSVFARVTPEQKELAVKTLRAAGCMVLMCGDGTNDVGALKGAHVGVALLPPPPPSKVKKPKKAAPKGKGALMLEEMRAKGKPVTPWLEKVAKSMDEMGQMAQMEESTMVKPGDASMASPFTAKQSSVMPCLDVLRQGRCTLVTTVQMFKILGLLCLSTAYSLSVLYLDGIKLGDMQATMMGLLTAGMFFFISHAQPLPELSRERPHPNVFCRYVFASLLGQFGVHMALLMLMQRTAHAVMPGDERQEPGGDFKPNLINTVCFLINFAIQTMTFAVNYIGAPFNTPLLQNKLFASSVRFGVVMYVLLVLDIPPGLSSWFSLVRIPAAMQLQMLALAFGAFAAAMAIERGARAAFPSAQTPEKGGLRRVAAAPAARRKED